MIKGNELDVANIVFEKLAKETTKFFCFISFLIGDNLSITLYPDVQFQWGVDQNVAFLSWQNMT